MYLARATIRGTFTMPPAKAQLQQQPEVMGLSSGGKFLISDDLSKEPSVTTSYTLPGVSEQIQMTLYGDSDVQSTQQRFYQTLLVGGSPSCKSTPLGVCSGRGGCSPANACVCDAGYTGGDCERDCSIDNSCPTDAPQYAPAPQATSLPISSSPISAASSNSPSASPSSGDARLSKSPEKKSDVVVTASASRTALRGVPMTCLFLLLVRWML